MIRGPFVDWMGFRRVKASNSKTLGCKLEKIANINTVLAKDPEVTRPDLRNRRWNHRWLLFTMDPKDQTVNNVRKYCR
jgi:hypothetical protein